MLLRAIHLGWEEGSIYPHTFVSYAFSGCTSTSTEWIPTISPLLNVFREVLRQEAGGTPMWPQGKSLYIASAQSWWKPAPNWSLWSKRRSRGFTVKYKTGPFRWLYLSILFLILYSWKTEKQIQHNRKTICSFKLTGTLQFEAWLAYLHSALTGCVVWKDFSEMSWGKEDSLIDSWDHRNRRDMKCCLVHMLPWSINSQHIVLSWHLNIVNWHNYFSEQSFTYFLG